MHLIFTVTLRTNCFCEDWSNCDVCLRLFHNAYFISLDEILMIDDFNDE